MPPKNQSLELEYEPPTDEEKVAIMKQFLKPKAKPQEPDIESIIAKKVEEALKTKAPVKRATDKQMKHLEQARMIKALKKKGAIPAKRPVPLAKKQEEMDELVNELYEEKEQTGKGIRKPVARTPRTYTPRMKTIEDVDEEEPVKRAAKEKNSENDELLARWAGTFGF